MIIPFARRALTAPPIASGLAAAVGGAIAAWHYHLLGLTLSHYDARGHLVVARRIIDSITPRWQQIGAVWLPLPHLVNAIPVQLDLFYRTGASAVAISIACYAVAVAAIVWIVRSLTDSTAAACAGAIVFALNPNVLYLQSTPLTEPLLVALTTTAIAMLMDAARLKPRAPASDNDATRLNPRAPARDNDAARLNPRATLPKRCGGLYCPGHGRHDDPRQCVHGLRRRSRRRAASGRRFTEFSTSPTTRP